MSTLENLQFSGDQPARPKAAEPYSPLTKDQILAELAISRKQVENGEYDDFDDALKRIETEYDI